jgi:sigma-B regulation protein RsbU (phosphoserine phosphatase)
MVGGDFFHVEQLSDMCAGVFMADVMGHGLRSALVTVMLRTLLEELQPESKKPGELLALVNSEIYKILKELGKDVVYATALYLILDVVENTVTYASAGHPCPIRIGRNAEKVESLEHPNANTLLGLFEDMEFDSHTWEIEPEDSILIFTDGAFEVENNKGEEFGVERMLRLIENKINRSSVEIIEHIKEEVCDFSKNQNFTDDVCFLAIDIAHAF